MRFSDRFLWRNWVVRGHSDEKSILRLELQFEEVCSSGCMPCRHYLVDGSFVRFGLRAGGGRRLWY